MHCPRCGQQQVSEETKFCSRCGFPLGLVSEVLSHGGFLPQLANLQKNKKLFTRQNGLKVGLVWFLVVTFLLVPLAAVTDAPSEIVAFLAIVGFVGGLLMMLLSWLFLQKETNSDFGQFPAQSENIAAQFTSENQRRAMALPPPQSQPVSSYIPPAAGNWKAPDTGDLVPRSVTENTTKLLSKDE